MPLVIAKILTPVSMLLHRSRLVKEKLYIVCVGLDTIRTSEIVLLPVITAALYASTHSPPYVGMSISTVRFETPLAIKLTVGAEASPANTKNFLD